LIRPHCSESSVEKRAIAELQAERSAPFLNLFDTAIGPAIAVAIACVPVLEKPLILLFQLPISFESVETRRSGIA
jgi:hypothetical protein